MAASANAVLALPDERLAIETCRASEPEVALALLANDPSAPVLTSAERRVLLLLLRGFGNDAIAAARGTAVRTVANQVSTLLRKFGTGSRTELAAQVARLAHGEIELEQRAREASSAALTLARLNPRQRLALGLRARGHSLKYIGYELGVTPSTVSGVLKSGMRALGVRSGLELSTLFALTNPANG